MLLHYIIFLSNFLCYNKFLYIDIWTTPKVRTTAERKRFCICFYRRRRIHRRRVPKSKRCVRYYHLCAAVTYDEIDNIILSMVIVLYNNI